MLMHAPDVTNTISSEPAANMTSTNYLNTAAFAKPSPQVAAACKAAVDCIDYLGVGTRQCQDFIQHGLSAHADLTGVRAFERHDDVRAEFESRELEDATRDDDVLPGGRERAWNGHLVGVPHVAIRVALVGLASADVELAEDTRATD